MKSLAVTFSGLCPRTTTLTVSGTVSRTSFVIQELKIAVVPTPNATHPIAPACGVWESEPMITIPGSACPSSIFEWQIASAPWRPSRSWPYSLIPCRREDDFPLEPGDVEVEQPAVLDDAARDLALALGEGCERNRLAAPHSVDDREVGSGEYSQILAILPVDPLDVLGDDQLDAGAHLGVRRLLPRRALAAPLAADRRHEATALHRSPRDRELLAAFQAQVREVAQRFVVVVADVGRRDLVGRNVVAQRDGRGPVQVLPRKLAAHQRGVLGQ